MAIALLLDAHIDNTHHAKYDLESLMYVCFFCATMLKGLYDDWRTEVDFRAQESTLMREWFDLRDLEATYKQMGRKKVSHMAIFESSIIEKMAPYFQPLFLGFRALKNAVFPPGGEYTNSPINHDTMITIFNDILSNLPEQHTVAAPMRPKRGVKRALPCKFIQYFAMASILIYIRCLNITIHHDLSFLELPLLYAPLSFFQLFASAWSLVPSDVPARLGLKAAAKARL